MRIDPMMFPILLYLLKATAILLLALGVALLLRRASAGTRHLVWLAAVVVVVALPAFGAALPDLQVLPLPAAEQAVAGATERFERPAAQLDDVSNQAAGLTSTGTAAPHVPPALEEVTASSRLGDRIERWLATADLWRTLFLLWLAGTLLVLARLAHSAYSLRRILTTAEPLTDAGWTTPLYEAADRLNLEKAPRLLQSKRVAMPFACGLLVPTIVMPASATEWSAPRRRAVLFHELAHIRRRDLFGHALGRIACALYWMHPLVWAAAYRLRAESERACDDLVLSTGTPASEYADHLLQILVGVRTNDAPAVALPMGRRREFEGRLLAILDPALRRHRPTLAHAAVLIAFSLCAAGLVALAPAEASGSAARHDPARERLAALADADSQVEGTDAQRDQRQQQQRVPPPPQPDQLPSAAPNPRAAPQTQVENQRRPHDLEDVIESVATEFGHGVAGLVESIAGSTLQAVLGSSATQEKDVALLARLLATDSSADVRRTAAWGLHGTADARATTALIRALRSDADAEVREMAAWALHETSTEPVISALAAAARDANEEVRATAVWGLGHVAPPDQQTLALLSEALSDPHAEVALRAAWAMGTLHPSAAPAALHEDGLRHADAEVRVAAAWALGQIADPASQAALGRALREERESEPLKAVTWALLELGPIEPQALEQLLASDDAELRAQAIRILAGAGSTFHPWPWPWPEPRVFP